MLGQVATLRAGDADPGAAPGGHRRRRRRCWSRLGESRRRSWRRSATDIAIVGIASVLPRQTTRQYWQNILDKVGDHRDPFAPLGLAPLFRRRPHRQDQIYSSGAAFSTTWRSIRCAMACRRIDHVGRPVIDGAPGSRGERGRGLSREAFDRERASVIVGASGVGDVGSQYGMRSELPRFPGVARRRGRPAASGPGTVRRHPDQRHRRPDRQPAPISGVNFTTDAACLVAGGDLPRPPGSPPDQRPSSRQRRHGTGALRLPLLQPRRRRCRRAACSTFGASGDGIVISKASPWWRSNARRCRARRGQDLRRDQGVGGGATAMPRLTTSLPRISYRAMRRAYAMARFGQAASAYSRSSTGTVAGDSASAEHDRADPGKNGVVPRQPPSAR